MDSVQQILQRLLVIRCQAGDQRALEELYRTHAPALGYYLRRLLRHEELAADLQQEVWLTVIRKIGGLRAPDAFVVWLYRIARAKAMDRAGDRLATVPLEEDHIEAEIADDSEPAFTAADAARVHAGLEDLPPPQREVLVLRFMQELSYEQIAQVVGCSMGTVRSRLHYAKLGLKKILDNQMEKQP